MMAMLATVSNEGEKLVFLRLPEVLRRTGLGRSTLYSLIAAGEFPSSVLLSGRSVGFVESEVDAWVLSRIALRDQRNGS